MVVRDGFSRTLGQEPGVGLAVVADHDRAMAQMNDFDGMGVAGYGRRMVVVPAVRRRCRARGHQSGALLGGIPLHVPSVISAAVHPVNTVRSPAHPRGQDAPNTNVPCFNTPPQPVLVASDIRPVRTVGRMSPRGSPAPAGLKAA